MKIDFIYVYTIKKENSLIPERSVKNVAKSFDFFKM